MTWFLRKSLRLGPLRLNLSKRGLGASLGVKGARLGVDAEGKPYVFGGRRGFYFRQRLGPGRVSPGAPGPTTPAQLPPPDHRRGRWWLLVAVALLLGVALSAWLAGGPR